MRYVLILLVVALMMVGTTVQAGTLSGGFDWSDLQVYYNANDKTGAAEASIYLSTPYKIEDAGTNFRTSWYDSTYFTWTAKCNVELVTDSLSSSMYESMSISRRGFTFDNSASTGWWLDGDDGHRNYFSANFFLDPATITNARFTWNESEESNFAYGLFEVNGFLKGERAESFGTSFQEAAPVPEPCTLGLLAIGSSMFFLRRRRS